MKIAGLIWLYDIVEKIAQKHHVQQNEVREVLENRSKFRFVENGNRPDEDVYAASGQTNGGRYLIIFFVHKTDDKAVILTARDMTKAERKRYEEK
ncbi:MAG: uncharacterized protein HW384_971 [Dehalococcoidia bacterium]|nr:uncharacterized protein [Dehalococcoidia bacterium]